VSVAGKEWMLCAPLDEQRHQLPWNRNWKIVEEMYAGP